MIISKGIRTISINYQINILPELQTKQENTYIVAKQILNFNQLEKIWSKTKITIYLPLLISHF